MEDQRSFALLVDNELQNIIELGKLPMLFKSHFHESEGFIVPESAPYLGRQAIVIRDEKMKSYNAFYFIKEEKEKLLNRILEKCDMSESFHSNQFKTFRVPPARAFNDYAALAIFYDCQSELTQDWRSLKEEFNQDIQFSDIALSVET